MFKNIQPVTQYRLIIITAIFLTIFTNIPFLKNVIEVYPLNALNSAFVLSLFVVLAAFIVLLLTLLSSRYTTKTLLISFLIISAFTSYFMNSYHIVIDDSMIRNSIQTDLHESMDLLSIELVGYLLFLEDYLLDVLVRCAALSISHEVDHYQQEVHLLALNIQ